MDTVPSAPRHKSVRLPAMSILLVLAAYLASGYAIRDFLFFMAAGALLSGASYKLIVWKFEWNKEYTTMWEQQEYFGHLLTAFTIPGALYCLGKALSAIF